MVEQMRHARHSIRYFFDFTRKTAVSASHRFSQRVVGGGILLSFLGVADVAAALQIAWERPNSPAPQVLKEYAVTDLEARKLVSISENDPLAKGAPAQFSGLSLATLVDEATKGLTAADRSDADLVVLKTRAGREVLMPKAFLVKYPQIQVSFRKNGQSLGADGPRVVLPATTNAKIRKENVLLEPMFVSELAAVTLSSYEKRYGMFILKKRTDPAAMRGEKLYLQNCVACHRQPDAAGSVIGSTERIKSVTEGAHPTIPGNPGFKSIFDKKSVRSLESYLEAFRFQTAKN